MSIGGRYSVRGYRENYMVRDQAFISSLEARIPLVQNAALADYLQLCPFWDYGWGDNKDLPTGDPKDISSAGLGVRWAASPVRTVPGLKAEAEIYWGVPFTHVGPPRDDIQDSGIHFQFVVKDLF